MVTDTIAAIATAGSNSGIGIIRISGSEAFPVADRIFHPKKGSAKVSEMVSHTVHYGTIFDGEERIDEVLLLVMRAPKTYTREDIVEIDCHGGALVMKRLLETVLKYGARPAEPGEFTKRAFLNGRIDLSQAESVIDVINAKNDLALKCSVSQLQGSVREKIKEMREILLHELAFIESALDDPEHYTLEGYYDTLRNKISDLSARVRKMIHSADNGKMIKEGIRTVITGKPNAGKSSLLNVLVGSERAIVTEIAGTTRDLLEEQIQIGGIGLNVIDTAGIRHTDDMVEKIGVARSRDCLETADLILYVVDSSTDLDENDREIMDAIREKKAIILLNKSDLETRVTEKDIQTLPDHPVIAVSAKKNTGFRELEDKITEMFFDGNISFNDEVCITNIRQKNALAEAEKSLNMVLESMDHQMAEDFLTIDLMNAYAELGKIIGEAVEDDLVNEIFRDFCMGK